MIKIRTHLSKGDLQVKMAVVGDPFIKRCLGWAHTLKTIASILILLPIRIYSVFIVIIYLYKAKMYLTFFFVLFYTVAWFLSTYIFIMKEDSVSLTYLMHSLELIPNTSCLQLDSVYVILGLLHSLFLKY